MHSANYCHQFQSRVLPLGTLTQKLPPTSAIARARRQIELLEEYRTRLIADVVTGKLDVRAAATGLPDEEDDELRCADGGPETSLDRGAGKVLEIFEETAT